MLIPVATFLQNRGGRKISSIEFLAIKASDGVLRSNEGGLSTTGNLATLTATGGNDMYVTGAQVVFHINTGSAAISLADEVVMKVNGTIVETSKISIGSTGSGEGLHTVIYEFKNLGHKVTTGQIIKLEVITLDADTDVEGFIQCIESATGVSPQIPSI